MISARVPDQVKAFSDWMRILPCEPPSEVCSEFRPSHFTLPPHQLTKARSRLSFLTFLFTCMCLVGIGIDKFFGDFYTQSNLPVFIFNGITSTLLFCLTLYKRLGDRIVLNLGWIYEILMCLSVSLSFNWTQYQTSETLPGITWICVVLVAYPLIIPAPPRRTFLASLIAASTAPLSLLILVQFAGMTVRPFDYLDVSWSPLLCVALAVMGSRVIYGLNIEVARAQQMGSYQLRELLGKGGMGEVWRAEHRLLARPAAIKLIRPDVQLSSRPTDNERVLGRFKREAEVTAGLKSPHTVNLFDFGMTDEGVFYYVMELLAGVDLDTLVNKFGPLPAERVAHILLQVCHSLREAHDQGLIHRDIKPANLMLCGERACDYDVIQVLDFGLVALRPAADPDRARLTADGQVSGTPAFMSPEMITEEKVDARTDIYALGCVAYWLLTAQFVFEAAGPMKIVLAHVREEPVAPSKRTEIEIPAALDRLVLTCLEKDPDRRPQSARALADELHHSGLATGWTQARAREWWEVHRPALVVARDLP